MVQYHGGEKYNINIDNLQGTFSIQTLETLLEELMEKGNMGPTTDEIAVAYQEGYGAAEDIYGTDWSQGLDHGYENGFENGFNTGYERAKKDAIENLTQLRI